MSQDPVLLNRDGESGTGPITKPKGNPFPTSAPTAQIPALPVPSLLVPTTTAPGIPLPDILTAAARQRSRQAPNLLAPATQPQQRQAPGRRSSSPVDDDTQGPTLLSPNRSSAYLADPLTPAIRNGEYQPPELLAPGARAGSRAAARSTAAGIAAAGSTATDRAANAEASHEADRTRADANRNGGQAPSLLARTAEQDDERDHPGSTSSQRGHGPALPPPPGQDRGRASAGGRGARARRRKLPVIVTGVAVVLAAGGGVAFVLPRLGPAPAAASTTTVQPVVGATSPAAAVSTAAPEPSVAVGTALAVKKTITVPGKALPWPTSGQARVEIAGLGVVGHSGGDEPVPIASVTKVMTAYVILRDHPLGAGESGPKITVSKAEAGAYSGQRAKGESLVRVASGEKITERQALQALMLASGDNMAQILADWDAGSQSAFVARMNARAGHLGMTSTHYDDASGLNPASRSTATDLLALAPVAMAEPAFAEIVDESSAVIPLNTVRNYNTLVGRDGVIGIKTGSTMAAGGCLLFAAHHTVAGHTYTIYGALLGAPGSPSTILGNALSRSDDLIVATGRSLHKVTLLHAGETVVTQTNATGTTTNYTVAHTLSRMAWSKQAFHLSLPTPAHPGDAPTTLTVRTPTETLHIPLIPQ